MLIFKNLYPKIVLIPDGTTSSVDDINVVVFVVDTTAVDDTIVVIEDVLVVAGDDRGRGGVEEAAGRSDGEGSSRITVTACEGGPVPTCVWAATVT